jgi:NAD(P)H-hydrate epimerase
MLSAEACVELESLLNKVDCVLVGPGLGRSIGTETVVRHVLEYFNGPVIVDADGINVINEHKDILRRRTGVTILTPHEGEFSRFIQASVTDRREDARTIAADTRCIMLLKGHETVITDGQKIYVNATGNPGMAVGGSGDLLAGVILGLLGQSVDPITAAAAGAMVHGMAGDVCAEQLGVVGMLPTDMLEVLPRLFK